MRDKNSHYKTSKVLEKIDKWKHKELIKQEIFLFEKKKLHDRAITKLVEEYKLYEWAEQYCA